MTIYEALSKVAAHSKHPDAGEHLTAILALVDTIGHDEMEAARNNFLPFDDPAKHDVEGYLSIAIGPLDDLEPTVLTFSAVHTKLNTELLKLDIPLPILELMMTLSGGGVMLISPNPDVSKAMAIMEQQRMVLAAIKVSVIPLMARVGYGASSPVDLRFPGCVHVRRNEEGALVAQACSLRSYAETLEEALSS